MDLERVQLTRRLVLWQRTRGHRSATDDILCAYTGNAAKPDAGSILDLGAGQGSVALMLAGINPKAAITAVEVQQVSYELLERNVKENGLAGRVVPILADLRTVDLGARRFDLVTGSPPYVRHGAGVLPADAQRAAARFELRFSAQAMARRMLGVSALKPITSLRSIAAFISWSVAMRSSCSSVGMPSRSSIAPM